MIGVGESQIPSSKVTGILINIEFIQIIGLIIEANVNLI